RVEMSETDRIAVLRIIDAAANRAAEGARVVEDYLRFAVDDRFLTNDCKQWRHTLQEALTRLAPADLHAARETQHDVGTSLTTPSEQTRVDVNAVAAASFGRVEQAVRSLEEYGKIIDPALAAQFEELRYAWYTLERAAAIGNESARRLD